MPRKLAALSGPLGTWGQGRQHLEHSLDTRKPFLLLDSTENWEAYKKTRKWLRKQCIWIICNAFWLHWQVLSNQRIGGWVLAVRWDRVMGREVGKVVCAQEDTVHVIYVAKLRLSGDRKWWKPALQVRCSKLPCYSRKVSWPQPVIHYLSTPQIPLTNYCQDCVGWQFSRESSRLRRHWVCTLTLLSSPNPWWSNFVIQTVSEHVFSDNLCFVYISFAGDWSRRDTWNAHRCKWELFFPK